MPDPGKFSCIYDMNVLFEQSDQRAASFLQQRIPIALQIGNAACVLGTVSDRDPFEEIYYIYNYHTYIFLETCISLQLLLKLVSTGRLE